MTEKINLLERLFSGCETSNDVASRILSLVPDYKDLTSRFNGEGSYLANRVLGVAKQNGNQMCIDGAIEAGAYADYEPIERDLFFVRQLCLRKGLIDGLSPSEDLQYCR